MSGRRGQPQSVARLLGGEIVRVGVVKRIVEKNEQAG